MESIKLLSRVLFKFLSKDSFSFKAIRQYLTNTFNSSSFLTIFIFINFSTISFASNCDFLSFFKLKNKIFLSRESSSSFGELEFLILSRIDIGIREIELL